MSSILHTIITTKSPYYLSSYLDSMDPRERQHFLYTLTPANLRELWLKFEPRKTISLDHFVPPSRGSKVVEHIGINSLPFFRRFKKHFYRDRQDGSIYGYNTSSIEILVGPGYFHAYDHTDKESVFDYRIVPDLHQKGLPTIVTNDHLLAKLSFGNLLDRVRKVSEHISIGSATRSGKELGIYFALCRIDIPAASKPISKVV